MATKESLFHFYLILKDYSDENNPLSSTDIITLMKDKYNENITRQTIYSYADYLSELNVDVIKTAKGMYIVTLFEPEEVDWLYHSILSNSTLPESYSRELIQKILMTQSINERMSKEKLLNIVNVDKKENKQIMLNLKVINEAINDNYSIEFMYTKYNTEKEIVNRRAEPYNVVPYCVVSHATKMYLICTYLDNKDFSVYRLDRMIDVKVKEKVYRTNDVNPYDYVSSRLYMHTGNLNCFRFRCSHRILDDVIDMFGKGVEIYNVTDDTFDFYIKTTKKDAKIFAMQFINYSEIIYPTELRDEIKQDLLASVEKYSKIIK